MSALAEWSSEMTLTTPQGTVLFNQDDGDGVRWQLLPDECDATQDIAALVEKISGGDGSILSRRSRSGFAMRLTAVPFKNGAFAIEDDWVAMFADLKLKLNSLFNPSLSELVSSCRLQWEQSGEDDDWMLDRARLFEDPNPTGVYPKKVTFTLDTEYPYILRASQYTTNLVSGVPAVLDHSLGTTPTFGTIIVDGPFSTFTLENADALDANGNPLQIVYDDSLPGPPPHVGTGDYVEISCFRETVVLNGDEDFGSIAGIDIVASELRLPIVPGGNTVTLTGADGQILWNAARA